LSLRERSRDVKVSGWLDALFNDTRFGLRMLRKDLLVSSAAVLSLALAMGACIAAFSLIDALVLRPLPVHDPDSLIHLTYPHFIEDTNTDQGEIASFSYPLFERLRAAGRDRVSLFAVGYQGPTKAIFADSPDRDDSIYPQFTSGNTFAELGIVPAAGRLLTAADDEKPGAHPVAVLSHGFWMRRFGGDTGVIGRWVTIERKQFQIIGVAREGFTGVEPGIRTDLWVPMMMGESEALTNGGWQWFRVLGRLRSGVDGDQARALLQPVFSDFRRERLREFRHDEKEERRERYVRTPLFVRSASTGPSSLRASFERPLWILAAVVGLVLLIACSNVANLLMARGAAREREMALRISIGAGRGRLLQQLLVESGLVAGFACALAALFATVAAPVIVSMLGAPEAPVYLELTPDWRLLGFVVATAVTAALLFGLTPALRASNVSPIAALKATGGRTSSRGQVLRPLLAAQVAFSLTILFIAGLLTVSFTRLTRIELGFDKSGLTLVTIASSSNEDNPAVKRVVVEQIRDRVRGVPGVSAASLSRWALFDGSGWSTEIRIPGRPPDTTEVYYLEVSPGFIDAMGIPLRDGRDLVTRDAEPQEPRPVLVNEAFARRYFPEERAIDRQFGRVADHDSLVAQQIVGVVGDAKYRDLRRPVPPTVYVPLEGTSRFKGMTLQIRSSSHPSLLVSAVRRVLQQVQPLLEISEVRNQAALVDNTLLKERLLALLSGFFGVVSLALAVIGLYGVLSYSVVQRTREIGIRMALGAPRRAVIRSVLTDIAVVIGAGLVVGVGGGMVLARFVRAILYEVTPYDVTSIALPLFVLLAAAVAAAVPPARCATRVDPIEALRYE
jgi:predicted permease